MDQTSPRERPEKIHALTSLRFFAAFYVVLYHSFPAVFPELTGSLLALFIAVGYISVSFFFLLSGYILAVVYLRNDRPIHKPSFYAARFARVYPLFLLTLLADTPDLLLRRMLLNGWSRAIWQTVATFVSHLFMLQAWLSWLQGIDPPNWSLSVETVFYIAFPFIAYYFWRMKGARLWITGISLWVFGQLVATFVGPHVIEKTARFHPLFHIWTFPIGILLAKWQMMHRQKNGASPRRNVSVMIVLLLAIAVFAAIPLTGNRIPLPNLNSGLLIPIFAAVIWACSGSRTWISRVLSAKWLVILGEASYGLYLIHMPVHHLFIWMHWDESKALWPVYLAACVGLSLLSFFFVEKPSRKWLLHIFHTHTKETLETASSAQ